MSGLIARWTEFWAKKSAPPTTATGTDGITYTLAVPHTDTCRAYWKHPTDDFFYWQEVTPGVFEQSCRAII